MTIKAIETTYKGYRFRSRLEARWAVFFDALGVRWEYEPEGYDLGEAGWYLPDFRTISQCGLITWWEIKPSHVTSDEKVEAFRAAIDAQFEKSEAGNIEYLQSVNFANGDPAEVLSRQGFCPRCLAFNGLAYLPSVRRSYFHPEQSGYCGTCDMTTPTGGGHSTQYDALIPYTPHKGYLHFEENDWRNLERMIFVAVNAARAARFEHGE